MNLRQIEAFQAVITTGSVTSGADLLNISQPAVSRLISDLERSCGLKLFARKGRRLQPTPEAMAFYEEVKRAFVSLAALKQAARDIGNFSTGHLRIAAQCSLGMSFLPSAISSFLAEFPNVNVSLQIRSTEMVKELTATQQFDVAFMYGPLAIPEHRMETFADVDCVCIIPVDHRLADKSVIEASDLHGETFVSTVRDDVARHQVDQIFERTGVAPNKNIETPYAATICNFVTNGAGVSVVCPFAAVGFRGQGLLMKRFVPAVPIQYRLVVPVTRPQSTIATKFIAVLKKHRDEMLVEFDKL